MTDKEREANTNELPIEDLSNEQELPQNTDAVKGGATSGGSGGTQTNQESSGPRIGSMGSN